MLVWSGKLKEKNSKQTTKLQKTNPEDNNNQTKNQTKPTKSKHTNKQRNTNKQTQPLGSAS